MMTPKKPPRKIKVKAPTKVAANSKSEVLIYVVMVMLSVNLLYTATRIRSHLGAFINMISKGDGGVLPTLLALPVFLFLCLDTGIFFLIYKIFSRKKSPGVNQVLFISILIAVVMILMMTPKKPPRKIKVKAPTKVAANSKSEVTVKFGKPVLQVTFQKIKSFVTFFVLIYVVMVMLSVNLLYTAIRIRSHLGAFINMISKGDGEVLPTLLALPVFLFLCLDTGIFFLIYKIFSRKKSPGVNQVLFISILIAVVMIVVTLIVIFATLGHVYGSSKGIEDGIIKAMEKYAENSFYKKQIDRLQFEFQCCGSNKYNDWYNISWMEKAMSTNSSTTQSGKTPFSCCAIKTKFPCIHYDIDQVGVNYFYTPEFNLSVSATGCHTRVVEKKRQVGLGIIGSLFLYMFFECLMLVPARFLQTGHSVEGKFEGNSKNYVVWLLGSYTGRNQMNGPPEPPPVPIDLMD